MCRCHSVAAGVLDYNRQIQQWILALSLKEEEIIEEILRHDNNYLNKM